MLGASRGRRNWSRWVMCGQGADLDEVVGEYSVAAPDSRPGEGFTQCVPSVAAFEVVYTVITLVRHLILARRAFRCSNSRRVALGLLARGIATAYPSSCNSGPPPRTRSRDQRLRPWAHDQQAMRSVRSSAPIAGDPQGYDLDGVAERLFARIKVIGECF